MGRGYVQRRDVIGRGREERFSAVARRVDSAPLRFRLVSAYDVPRGLSQNTFFDFLLSAKGKQSFPLLRMKRAT